MTIFQILQLVDLLDNDYLCYTVSNATSYDFTAINRWGNEVYSSSGNVSGTTACVWDGTGSNSYTWYAIIVTFANECNEQTNAHDVYVIGDGNKSEKKSDFDSTNVNNSLLLNIIPEHEPQNFNFEVFPNPTNGNFSILIKSTELTPYSCEIINSAGVLIYKIKNINEQKIEINKTGFSSGIYYIRLNNGKTLITKKIIIN